MTSKYMVWTIVNRLEVNFESRTAYLYMQPNCCCDMTECIKWFQKIDPNVICIATFEGDKPSTRYQLAGGEWEAFGARPPVKEAV